MRCYLTILLVCFFGVISFAQKTMHEAETPIIRCAAMDVLKHDERHVPNLHLHAEEMERKALEWIEQNPNPRVADYRIPIVFHVVYNSSAQNISDKYIYAQLDQLNQDFQGLNTDYGNVPSEFPKGHPNIEFCLAKIDPNGNPTTGINRKRTTVSGFEAETGNNQAVKNSSLGGVDAWDTKRYFNVWICNLTGGVLGYAQFPQQYNSRPNMDGLVLGYGTIGSLTQPNPNGGVYTRGRTATHEVGHCLGLYHIWGDDNHDDDPSNDCDGSDGIADTPNQREPSEGCPTYPTRSCGTTDMTMNYMDYSNDLCLYAFTKGQSQKMVANINTYDHLKSKVAAAPTVCNTDLTAVFKATAESGCVPLEVNFTDASFGGATTWVWSFEGGTPSSFTGQTPPTVTFNTPGIHKVTLAVSNDNGTSIYSSSITTTDCSQFSCSSIDHLNGKALVLIPNDSNTSTSTTTQGGFISGHNGFNDKAVAEHFQNVGANAKLNGVEFSFGHASGSNQDVIFYIWSDDNGKPGDILYSDEVSINQIVSDVNNKKRTRVDFGGLVSVPNSFFVGVDLTDNTFEVALHTNSHGDTKPPTAWALLASDTWIAFSDTESPDNTWGFDMALAVYANICFSTSTPELTGLQDLLIRPNPVSDKLTVSFGVKETMDLQLEIYNLLGQKVIDDRQLNVSSFATEEINVAHLPKGTYFIRLTSGNRALTKRFLKL